VTGGGGVDAGKTAPGEDRPVPIDRDSVLSVGVAPLRDAWWFETWNRRLFWTIGNAH
jgi:hypothetical protein